MKSAGATVISIFLYFIILFTGTCNSVFSDETIPPIKVDHKRIYEMVLELQDLYNSGITMHNGYDLNNIYALKKCVKKNNPLREKAKKIADEAKGIGELSYRMKLYPAAWAAFECVYCGGTGKSCNDIQPYLTETKELLKQDGFKIPKN